MSAGRLAEVLGAHHLLRYIEGFGYRCACGVGFSHLWLHADHLAAVVAEWLTGDGAVEVVARELRAEERNASMSDFDWGDWGDAGEAEQGAYRYLARGQLAALAAHAKGEAS